ncbi:MAG: ATP-binding cassette domain-containing protein [Pseudomonadota bacterium]
MRRHEDTLSGLPLAGGTAAAAPTQAAPDDTPLVTLEDVVLTRGGQRRLDGLSAGLGRPGITALMGPNGAGKSLTLRLAGGLLAPDAGRIAEAPALAGRRAIVFQKPVLLRRSVRGNLLHALRLYGLRRNLRPARADALLAEGGLAALAESPARALSGGEQQRLALIRALAAEPRLLLLDEPTASLDPAATAAIEALVRRAAEAGTRVLIVTHDAGQARRLAERVVFLHRGRVAEERAARGFFAAPASEPARAFLEGRLLV